MSDCAEIKRRWRAERAAECQAEWDQYRRQRRCFWTRPFGHAWEPITDLTAKCLCCGKTKWIGGDF